MWEGLGGQLIIIQIPLNYSMKFHLPVIHIKKGTRVPLVHVSRCFNYNWLNERVNNLSANDQFYWLLHVWANQLIYFVSKQQVNKITWKLHRLETATPYKIMQSNNIKFPPKMIKLHKRIYCRVVVLLHELKRCCCCCIHPCECCCSLMEEVTRTGLIP